MNAQRLVLSGNYSRPGCEEQRSTKVDGSIAIEADLDGAREDDAGGKGGRHMLRRNLQGGPGSFRLGWSLGNISYGVSALATHGLRTGMEAP